MLSGGKLTDDEVRYLSKCLERFHPLQRIELTFLKCFGITSLGLLHIGKSLHQLNSLQYLDFDFYDCHGVTDVGMEWLSSYLRGLRCLKFLNLKMNFARELQIKG